MAVPSKFNTFANRIFGRFKETEAVETFRKDLENEYEEFLGFEQNPDYVRYSELKQWIDSGEHIKIKKELEALVYNGSSEHKLEEEFKKLHNDKLIKNYLKLIETETPKFYNEFKASGVIDEYNQLKEFVESTEYKRDRKNHKKDKTDEYQKELRYNELKKNADLKKFLKLGKWKPLLMFLQVVESEMLQRYGELKEHVNSSEFKERKDYLQRKDKYKNSEAYLKEQEYNTLHNSDKIKWFFSVKKGNKFDELKAWQLAFYDDFEKKSLNADNWLTKFFWGDVILHKSYSFSNGVLNNYTDKGNIEIENSVAKLITKKEQSEGVAWDRKYGFVPKTFQYTSPTINTGHVFRLDEGKVEAKVRMSCVPGVSHVFYLTGEKVLPEIDVFLKNDSSQSTLLGSYFWQNSGNKIQKSITKIGGLKLQQKYYIVGVEWNSKSVIWTLNGTPFKVEINQNPGTPLYLVFASAVNSKIDESKLPATLEIDWVKCWKKA